MFGTLLCDPNFILFVYLLSTHRSQALRRALSFLVPWVVIKKKVQNLGIKHDFVHKGNKVTCEGASLFPLSWV